MGIPLVYFSKSPITRDGAVQSKEEIEFFPLHLSLGLRGGGPGLHVPDLSGEIILFLDPSRPGEINEDPHFFALLKKSGQVQRVHFPCRLDLEVKKDKIVVSKDLTDFWIEITENKDEQITGTGYITSLQGEKIAGESFILALNEPPIRNVGELGGRAPFKALAEGRWWGKDLLKVEFAPKISVERVEIHSRYFELEANDWLVWKEGFWQKSSHPEQGPPLARVQSIHGKALVLEGWDEEGYVRLALGHPPVGASRPKVEDILSAIRVRSEKQISCMIEKQCMVLKTGDWVLKSKGKWKVLRSEGERSSFLNGELLGDLFIFEQIVNKQGQKAIQGRLFHPGRTQVVNMEVMAQSTRKATGIKPRKGKTQ